MEFKTCYSCAGPLFSARKTLLSSASATMYLFTVTVLRTPRWNAVRHAGAYTDSIGSAFLWSPVHDRPSPPADIVVAEYSDDEGPGPSRPRRDDTTTCSICLKDGSLSERVLETTCCSRRAHVSCLRRYYNIPDTSKTEEERDMIKRNLGLPNCLVCRMDDRGIRPLPRSILIATLHRGEDACFSAYKQMAEAMEVHAGGESRKCWREICRLHGRNETNPGNISGKRRQRQGKYCQSPRAYPP